MRHVALFDSEGNPASGIIYPDSKMDSISESLKRWNDDPARIYVARYVTAGEIFDPLQAEVEAEYKFQREIEAQEINAERAAENARERYDDAWAQDCNSRG